MQALRRSLDQRFTDAKSSESGHRQEPQLDLLNIEVEKIVRVYRAICVHRAWEAANETSFMYLDANYDKGIADHAEGKLNKLLPGIAEELCSLVKEASWFAANTRRFLIFSARRNETAYQEAGKSLKRSIPKDTFDAMELMAVHASWHASNVRSMLWKDARADSDMFDAAADKLLSNLQDSQLVQQSRQPSKSIDQATALRHRTKSASLLREAFRVGATDEEIDNIIGSSEPEKDEKGLQALIQQKQAQSDGSCCHAGVQTLMFGKTSQSKSYVNRVKARDKNGFHCCSRHSNGFADILRDSIAQEGQWRQASLRDSSLRETGRWDMDVDEGEHAVVPPTHEVFFASGGSPSNAAAPHLLHVDSMEHTPLCRHANVLEDAVRTWRNVDVSNDSVPVSSFLVAASCIAMIFDGLGAAVKSVKSDIQGNIGKIQKNVDSLSREMTLQQMVENEIASSRTLAEASKEGSTSRALLWLGRMLRLTVRLVSDLLHYPEKSLADCTLAGYDACLSQHHPWAIRTGIRLAIKGSPSRDVFFEKLGETPDDGKKSLDPLLQAAQPVMDILLRFMIDKGFEKPDL